jgi:hypothetical protein
MLSGQSGCQVANYQVFQVVRFSGFYQATGIHIFYTSGFSDFSGYQVYRIPQIHTISTSGGQVDQVFQIIKLREIHIIFTSGFSGFQELIRL